MPTQQQIEYYRLKHQKFTSFKMKVSAFLGVVSSIATAPFELVKVRSQLLQEGRSLHGYGAERGVPSVRIAYEIIDSGVGLKGLFTGYDSLLMRGLWGGTWRSYFWCLCYNYFNKDPRRAPPFFLGSLANFSGGFFAGLITNPIDIVYNRQAADALYPKNFQRNYSSFLHGLTTVHAEGNIWRGATANGLSLGFMMGSMSYIYDYLKELGYYWVGPTLYLRPVSLFVTSLCGTFFYLPFDNIRVRLHTMRALPNGDLPYHGTFDAFTKILKYEGNHKKLSNFLSFHNGFTAACSKLYLTLLIGMYATDYVFQNNYKEGELWEASNVFYGPQQGIIPHDPFNNFDFNAEKTLSGNLPNKRIWLNQDTDSFIDAHYSTKNHKFKN